MVAYGFKKFFSPQIEAGIKTHTVRGDRRRHAHPDEPMQLYEGMRTRYCRKIIADPVCVAVLPIVIVSSDLLECGLAYIEIDGCPLHRDEIEHFARADGFAPEWVSGRTPYLKAETARENMGAFWRHHHAGVTRFEGKLIKWGKP